MTDLGPLSQSAVPTVCCVILNWNGWADTIDCLDSLASQDYPALRVLVIDNGSTNDSVTRIRAAHPNVSIIESDKNVGFHRGCNLGIRQAAANGDDFVWLLNNDTIAPPDTCSKLVACALAQPSVGLIGSVLYFMHDPVNVQAWGGGNINTWLGRTHHFNAPTHLGPHSYLTFASVLIPREIIYNVGVLYDGMFMYWDDVDYSLRATAAGYILAVAEDTAILHKEGGSSEPRSPVIDRYSVASGLHFLRRHSPTPHISMAIFITVKLLSRLARFSGKQLRAVVLACRDYYLQRNTVYSDTV